MSGEREQDRLLLNAQSGECSAFSQWARVTALSESSPGRGSQTMGVMKQEGGRLFKCRARNPFAPCAGLLYPLLQSFRTQQRVYVSRPLLAEIRRVLRKSPPLFRDSGGLFCGRAPRGNEGRGAGLALGAGAPCPVRNAIYLFSLGRIEWCRADLACFYCKGRNPRSNYLRLRS